VLLRAAQSLAAVGTPEGRVLTEPRLRLASRFCSLARALARDGSHATSQGRAQARVSANHSANSLTLAQTDEQRQAKAEQAAVKRQTKAALNQLASFSLEPRASISTTSADDDMRARTPTPDLSPIVLPSEADRGRPTARQRKRMSQMEREAERQASKEARRAQREAARADQPEGKRKRGSARRRDRVVFGKAIDGLEPDAPSPGTAGSPQHDADDSDAASETVAMALDA